MIRLLKKILLSWDMVGCALTVGGVYIEALSSQSNSRSDLVWLSGFKYLHCQW